MFDRDTIDRITTNKGVPKYIVSDHFTWFENIKEFYGLPLHIESNTKEIIDGLKFEDNISTSHCFNFMINRKQVNRFLCIKLVEWFKFINFDYTWSAVDQNFDMHLILAELDLLGDKLPLPKELKSFILSPIQLKKRFFEFSQTPSGNDEIHDCGGCQWRWCNGLGNMFLNSAVSLISESFSYQRASAFTEKTVYSVLGLTFPIWIGGYNQASEWKRLGFDIFEDVIDHSYQSYDTLIERCYYAFTKNLNILSNKEQAVELRNIHKDRLLQNRELLLQNHLGKFVDQEISKFPEDLQSVMPKILKYFR
jgi:hypothetical protein